MNGKTYFAFNQLVGFAVGVYTIGNEHIHQFAVGVAPYHIAGKALMSVCLVGGHGGQHAIVFFETGGVEAQSSSVAAVNGVGFGEKSNSFF